MSTVNPEIQQQEPPEDPDVLSDGGLFSDAPPSTDDSQWPIPDDEIEQTAQPAAAPAAVPQQPGQPQAAQPPAVDPNAIIEHRLPTGHVLRGTPAQVMQQMTELLQRDVNVPQQYQERIQRQQPPQRTDQRNNWNQKTFQENWYNQFTTDPYGAMEAFMKDYFGHDDPRGAFDKSYSTSVQVSDRIALADFMANNPDWPATKEAGAILVQRLAADGVELTSHNLEVGFNQLVREGRLARVQPQQPAPPPQQPPDYRSQYQQAPVPQTPAAPPTPPSSRGASAPPATPNGGIPPDRGNGIQWRLNRDEFDSLTLQEQRAYITNHSIPDRFFQQRRRG